jgi:anthranilate/para-aminobenzoate synthase component I
LLQVADETETKLDAEALLSLARALEAQWGAEGVRFFCRRTGKEGLPCPQADSYAVALQGPDALERVWNEAAGWDVVFVLGVNEECVTTRADTALAVLARARAARLPAIVVAPFPTGAKGLDAPVCAPWRVWVGQEERRVRVEHDGSSPFNERAQSDAEKALEHAFEHAQTHVLENDLVSEESLARLVAHEHAGDCYLANLTGLLVLSLPSPLSRASLPTPAAHLERVLKRGVRFGAHALSQAGQGVLLSSPERFLRVVDSRYVFTEPIKGTRPCSVPPRAAEAESLWASEKETAELVLVTDLLRNDLNLVCEPGSVQVYEPFFLRDAGGLLQMQSTVFGTLREQKAFPEVILASTLPAGSVSGTPKKRVRELLDALETEPRGAYTGIVGVLDSGGEFDSSVCIRSVFVDSRGVNVGVGVGVTALSDPKAECEEIRWKLEAVARFWKGPP